MPDQISIDEPGKTPQSGDGIRTGAADNWAIRLGWLGKTGIAQRDYELARAELVYGLFVLAFAAIIFCGLFPFNFGAQLGGFFAELHERFHWDFWGPKETATGFKLYLSALPTTDLVQNIIFFCPFGFALGAIAGRRFFGSWPKWIASLAVATLISFCLTAFIELSQTMLASRYSSESDIITNTLGGAVGFIVYRALGEYVVEIFAAIWARARRLIDARACAMIGLIWLLSAMVLAFWASDASGLDDWHTIYPLCLGNEPIGGVPFTGRVGCLFLADRAVTDGQADRLFAGDDFVSIVGAKSVLGAYRFHGFGPYADATGRLPTIEWVGGPPRGVERGALESGSMSSHSRLWAATFGGISLYADHWLRSVADMAAAVVPIRKSQAFTLMVDCKTYNPYIIGPARIATISVDRGSRNFTVAQDQQVLVVRMNTPETGGNGTDPEFEVNNVFTDPDSPHRILVTYQRPTLRIYVDGPERRYVSTLLPETMLVNRLYPRSWRYPIGGSGVELTPFVYRLCVLAPLGLLVAGATARMRRRRVAAAIVAIAVAMILDSLLQMLGHDGYSIMRLMFAIAVCVAAAVLVPPPAASNRAKPATAIDRSVIGF
jgi:glycopeptide antibiotics resistance protein